MTNTEEALNKITELLEAIQWGSIEIQLQNGKVVQISKREIWKPEGK